MIRINLLAKKVSKKKAGAIQHLAIGGVAILAALLVIGWLWISQRRELAGIMQKINVAQAEKNRLKDVNEKKSKYEKEQAELKRKLDIITKLQNERIVPVHLLDELTKVLDNNTPIWLVTYGYTPTGVTMEGYSLSNEALRPFSDGIEKSPYYKNVELLFTERSDMQGRTVYRFGMKAQVEQPE